MMSELLDMSDRRNASQSAFKVVKIRLGCRFFCLNNKLDQPIFNKRALQYDKHELAKVISYQQLELLFRPFKDSHSFKDFVRWQWILITYVIFFVLLIVTMIILQLDSDQFQQNDAIFLSIFLFSTIILMLVGVSSMVKKKKAIKALSLYCKKLDEQQDQISIKIVNSMLQRINGEYVEVHQQQGFEQLNRPNYQTYIHIQSKKVLNENKYIKIYKKKSTDLGNWFCDSEDQSIFQEQQFKFETRKLNRFIYFEELQLLLRAFKANYYYQRRLFWNRITVVSLFSISLIIMPLYLLEDNQLLYFIVLVIYVSTSQSMFWLGVYKSVKMNEKMLHQFKKYCEDISLTNSMIEIIMHLRDIKTQTCVSLSTSLYCLQIRIKGLQADMQE